MNIGNTEIEDTFAEAFGMKYVRLIVTAADEYWLTISGDCYEGTFEGTFCKSMSYIHTFDSYVPNNKKYEDTYMHMKQGNMVI